MSDPLSVLVITSQLPPDIGGTSVHAAEISKGLHALGHRVTVAIRDRDARQLGALGVEVVSVDTKSGWIKPLRIRRAQRHVLRLVRERQIQVVFFAYTVVGFGNLYRRLVREGVPYVVGIHGFNRSDLADDVAMTRRRRKWGLAGATRVIACTRWLAEQMEPLACQPVDTVNYGIDPAIDAWATPDRVLEIRRRLGLTGRLVLLCLGRYVPRKNFDGVLRVLPALAARFPELRLVMVGGGIEEEKLRRLASDLGMADRVVWGPQVAPHEVGVWYKAADLFVTVSLTRPEDDTYETFGLVFAEANLCGTPVVGGREGGVPEAVADGETGLLVPAGDPAALEAALVRLLGDEPLRRRMGAAGRARVRELFTWQRAARETAEILRAAARPRV